MKKLTHLIKSFRSATSHKTLAEKWLNFWNHPEDSQAIDQLGIEIDFLLRRFLPRGRIQGALINCEGEIRQEAGLRLFNRYLAGNTQLIAATQLNDLAAIEEQIRRAVWVALKVTIWQFRKKVRAWNQLFELSGEIHEHPHAVFNHPANYRRIGELPFEVQLQLVRATLRRAVREKQLSAQNAAIAAALFAGNLSQAQLAKIHGVSRQAINQRLAPVRRYLQSAIEKQEFPFT